MRTFEILLLLSNLPALARCFGARPMPGWAGPFQSLAGLILIIHLVVEGQRWQLYPAFGVTATLLALSTWASRVWPNPWLGALGLGGLASSAVLGMVLPIFEFPRPTGPFPIGTAIRHWIDSGRAEPLAGTPGSRRELMVQIWYPAERAGRRQPYVARAEVSFKKSHLSLVQTHASTGVPLATAPSRFPVLVFSPSWTGRRSQNTFLVQELASHGYVVVGIDHPFGSELTSFPDGRVARTVLDRWLDFSSDEAFDASLRRVEAELRARVGDVRFVLDELERSDRSDPTGLLTGRLDLTRIGIFGHSFGGAVAAEACRSDPRVLAGANFDGCVFGGAATAGAGKPFLVMGNGDPIPTNSDVAAAKGPERRYLSFIVRDTSQIRRSLAARGGYWVRILGSRHADFSDSPLFSPVRRLTGAGTIATARAFRIIDDYILNFFDSTLGGKNGPLLDGSSSPYPEVEFEAWRRPGLPTGAPAQPTRSTAPGSDRASDPGRPVDLQDVTSP